MLTLSAIKNSFANQTNKTGHKIITFVVWWPAMSSLHKKSLSIISSVETLNDFICVSTALLGKSIRLLTTCILNKFVIGKCFRFDAHVSWKCWHRRSFYIVCYCIVLSEWCPEDNWQKEEHLQTGTGKRATLLVVNISKWDDTDLACLYCTICNCEA